MDHPTFRNQAPWRAPGKWQMPDIIAEEWKRKQEVQLQNAKHKVKQRALPPSPPPSPPRVNTTANIKNSNHNNEDHELLNDDDDCLLFFMYILF